MHAPTAINRTQGIVLAFTLVAVIALVIILVADPSLYDANLRQLGLALVPNQVVDG